MRIFYSMAECPFTDEQLEAGFHGLPDSIKAKEHFDIPYISVDPNAPVRYDEVNALIADQIQIVLEAMPHVNSLGLVLLTDMKIIAHVGAVDFTKSPALLDDYFCRGLTIPFTIAVISIEGLTSPQAHKHFLHEMGHFYGLEHCTNPNCLMTHYEYQELDILDQLKELCLECQKKIQQNLVL